MKKIPVSRVHFGFSVNVDNREKTYLEADKETQIFYIPELYVLEVVTTKKGKKNVVHALAFNAKYYLPIMEETLADSSTSKANSKGSKETPASINA